MSIDLDNHLLSPTTSEVRDTRILFSTYKPVNEIEEMAKFKSLQKAGLNVTWTTDPNRMLGPLDYDFIFTTQIAGKFCGHEMLIPSLSAYRGIPCLGPTGPVRALSEDKVLGKMAAASAGIEVAKHLLIDVRDPDVLNRFPPGRWVLKPRNGVMSEHLSYVDDGGGWRRAIAAAVADPKHDGVAFIAEEFVPGLNIAVPIVEGFPSQSLTAFLETGEPRNNVLTKSGKEGKTRDYRSEPYAGPGAAEAKAAAAKLAATITPFDYARFDFRFEPLTGRLVFLEVNMNCAAGPRSVVARAAKDLGVDHPTLMGHIFAFSLRRQRKPS